MSCVTTYRKNRFALSLRWGDPKRCLAGEIEGVVCMAITYVLAGSLREVRRKDEIKVV